MTKPSKKPQAERTTTDENGLVIDIEPIEKPVKPKRRKAEKEGPVGNLCASLCLAGHSVVRQRKPKVTGEEKS